MEWSEPRPTEGIVRGEKAEGMVEAATVQVRAILRKGLLGEDLGTKMSIGEKRQKEDAGILLTRGMQEEGAEGVCDIERRTLQGQLKRDAGRKIGLLTAS